VQLRVDDILKLAPDDASAKAARGLASIASWSLLQADDAALWGECKGSGSKPYQVQVDRSGPAFRCSCPSRKFPCKHGLALLMLSVDAAARFERAAQPAWVREWLEGRSDRAMKQEQRKTESAAAPADPQAAAKREAARAARMAAGLQELSLWMRDRLRQGLAQLAPDAPIWDDLARRMIDAQLPGIATRVRRAGPEVGRSPDWPMRVLAALGQMQLLVEAHARLAELPVAVQSDVRAALGVTLDREAVLREGERVADEWRVQGQCFDELDRLWVRRVWLRGARSGRDALLLDFSHGSRNFQEVWLVGTTVAVTLAFAPGAAPLRAITVDDPRIGPAVPLGTDAFEAALDRLAVAAAANPWQVPLPLSFSGAVPARDEQGWCVHVDGRRLPMAVRDEAGWQLVALGGGARLDIAGEWDGRTLRPLCAWQQSPVWIEDAGAP